MGQLLLRIRLQVRQHVPQVHAYASGDLARLTATNRAMVPFGISTFYGEISAARHSAWLPLTGERKQGTEAVGS
jgi:hypothetical protein